MDRDIGGNGIDQGRSLKRSQMQKRLEKWSVIGAAIVTIVGFPLLILSLWFAHRVDETISEQLGEIKRIAQSQNSIALNTMLFNDPSNAGIIKAIQNDKPILVENGGSYSDVDLDKYLGAFNAIELVYRDGFLSDDHLCASFSFYIKEVNKNDEVKKYVAKYPNFFTGIRSLLPVVSKSTSEYCHLS
jgi:hypothetical protein